MIDKYLAFREWENQRYKRLREHLLEEFRAMDKTRIYWEVRICETEGQATVRLCRCINVESTLGVVKALLDLGENGPMQIFLDRRAET